MDTSGLVKVASTLDPPSTGKRPRPLKDVLWKIKRSRSEVGGNLAPVRPGFPTERDRIGTDGWLETQFSIPRPRVKARP